jgi:hypothetical protein
MLISAFEGGSNYWYMIDRYDYGEYAESDFVGNGKFANPEYDGSLHLYLIPFVPGCALIIVDYESDEKTPYRLDRPAMERGLKLMQENWPHHWKDFISEYDDSVTGDVFLQLCLFGDIVYG